MYAHRQGRDRLESGDSHSLTRPGELGYGMANSSCSRCSGGFGNRWHRRSGRAYCGPRKQGQECKEATPGRRAQMRGLHIMEEPPVLSGKTWWGASTSASCTVRRTAAVSLIWFRRWRTRQSDALHIHAGSPLGNTQVQYRT